jgi:molybdopterin molybdotransferase
VSTMVCFYLYARPALRKMGGHPKLGLPRVPVICATDIKVAANLTEFVRVRLERRDGEIYASPTGNQGSGILSSLSRADALLIGPTKENLLKAGSSAMVLLLDAHAATDEDAFFEAR